MQRKEKERNGVYWQFIFFLDENRFAKGGYSILSRVRVASEINQTLCIAKVYMIDSFIHARSDCILRIPFICSGSPN